MGLAFSSRIHIFRNFLGSKVKPDMRTMEIQYVVKNHKQNEKELERHLEMRYQNCVCAESTRIKSE